MAAGCGPTTLPPGATAQEGFLVDGRGGPGLGPRLAPFNEAADNPGERRQAKWLGDETLPRTEPVVVQMAILAASHEDHRDLGPAHREDRSEGHAVEPGAEVDIRDQDRRWPGRRRGLNGGLGRGRGRHLQANILQTASHRLPNQRVIFDDKHVHCGYSRARHLRIPTSPSPPASYVSPLTLIFSASFRGNV